MILGSFFCFTGRIAASLGCCVITYESILHITGYCLPISVNLLGLVDFLIDLVKRLPGYPDSQSKIHNLFADFFPKCKRWDRRHQLFKLVSIFPTIFLRTECVLLRIIDRSLLWISYILVSGPELRDFTLTI